MQELVEARRRLLEISGRDLWGGIDWDFIHMAQHFGAVQDLGTRYESTEGDMIHFMTQSETTPGHEWRQWIRMTELKDVITDPDMSLQDKVRLALSGDLQVHCNCPAFLYWGYQYITTQLGAAVSPENRPPDKKNPKRKGDVCKHLALVLRVLPFWWNNITSDLKKQGYDGYTKGGPPTTGPTQPTAPKTPGRAETPSVPKPAQRVQRAAKPDFLRQLWQRTARRERGEESLLRGRRTWPTFAQLVKERLNCA
jgi:hypothetical protein